MNPTLDKLFAGIVLLVSLMFTTGIARSECQPVTLQKHEGVDWNCRLFRRTTYDGVTRFERLDKNRRVVAIENVDCGSAVIEEGQRYYYLHIISGRAWCGPAPARKVAKR